MAVLKYINFDLSTSGHAGTSADPYDYVDLISSLSNLSADTDFACKGSKTVDRNLIYSKVYNVNLSAWDISTYGPWRLNFGATYSFQDKSSATFGDRLSIKDGILYDVSAFWVKNADTSFVYQNSNTNVVISRDCSASTFVYNSNITRAYSAIPNYRSCSFYSVNSNRVVSANVYNSHVSHLTSAVFVSGTGVTTSANLYNQVFNTIPNWTISDLTSFNLGHKTGVGLSTWARHQGFYYIDFEKTVKGNGSLEKPGTFEYIGEINVDPTSGTYKCKGIYNYFNGVSSASFNLDFATLDAWDTSVYGPWRIICKNTNNINIQIRNGRLMNGIIYGPNNCIVNTFSASDMYFDVKTVNVTNLTSAGNELPIGTFDRCSFNSTSAQQLINGPGINGNIAYVTFTDCIFANKGNYGDPSTVWYNISLGYWYENPYRIDFVNCKTNAQTIFADWMDSNANALIGVGSLLEYNSRNRVALNTPLSKSVLPTSKILSEFNLGTNVGPSWSKKSWTTNSLYGLWGEDRDGIGAFFFGSVSASDTSAVYYVDLNEAISGNSGTYNDPFNYYDFINSFTNISANHVEYRVKGSYESSAAINLTYNGATDVKNVVVTSWNNLLYGPWRFKVSGANITLNGTSFDNFVVRDGIIYDYGNNSINIYGSNTKVYNTFFYKDYKNGTNFGYELRGENLISSGVGPKFYACTFASNNNDLAMNTLNVLITYYDCVFKCKKVQTVAIGTPASSIIYNCVTTRAIFNAFTDVVDTITSGQYNWSAPTWPTWSADRNSFKYSVIGSGIIRKQTASTSANYRFGMWDSLRDGLGAAYFDYPYGHIGAFYFGPIEESIDAPIFTLSAEFLDPTVSVVNSVSSTIIAPVLVTEYRLLQPKSIYAFQDILVDFSARPVAGISPLAVQFTALVTFGGQYKNKYKVAEYRWCFNYDYVNDTCLEDWVVTTQNPITHVYTGYAGQKFSVKCCVKLQLL